MTRRTHGIFASLALALALAGPARADLKPGDQEQQVPDGQGNGQHPQQEKNPLPEIVERMKSVEKQLAEADTGTWTQEEQRRIAEALDLQGGAIEALAKFIEEIESRPSSAGGGGGGGESAGQPGGGKGKGQKQQKERQGDKQSQPVNPQGQQKPEPGGGQEQQPDSGKNQAKNDQKSPGEPEKTEYKLERGRSANAAESWGHLPAKQAGEINATRRKTPPLEWRKQIDDYFKRLSETKR